MNHPKFPRKFLLLRERERERGREMTSFFLIIILALLQPLSSTADGFIFNGGFQGDNLTLDGSARITTNGLIHLTNDSHTQMVGHAFFPSPFRFKNSTTSSSVASFSTRFAFAIRSNIEGVAGHGIAFTISPNPTVVGSLGIYYLGLFNSTNVGSSSNHILAVEFDTSKDPGFNDTDGNHVGIDVNTLFSTAAKPAAYFSTRSNRNETINLQSGSAILVWIDYESKLKQLNVSIAPVADPAKPKKPLLSCTLDLAGVVEDLMYVGFSAGVGKQSSDQYVLGWSFNTGGEAQDLDLSRLPSLPRTKDESRRATHIITASIIAGILVLLMMVSISCWVYCRRKKFCDKIEAWELEYPHRFSYKLLHKATKGFKDKELLGCGGFGSVYKGVLPETRQEIAVKRISHTAKQGLREFVAEISSLGRLRHRNVVQLQGWCRRQEELLLVYDFMPNGSLDSFVFAKTASKNLSWEHRFNILKGIASGLSYLHEGWEQVVVHRDVKASNVLLDREMNGKLGDFGLSRLYDHGRNPQTTCVVGTFGYMAPELSRTCKATTKADVYSFGTLLLEVVCGKRPIQVLKCTGEGGGTGEAGTGEEEEEEILLSEWVLRLSKRGELLKAVDPKLEGNFVREEAELVLKLGLLCSHMSPESRPSMRQVVQYLEGESSNSQELSLEGVLLQEDSEFYGLNLSHPDSFSHAFNSTSSL